MFFTNKVYISNETNHSFQQEKVQNQQKKGQNQQFIDTLLLPILLFIGIFIFIYLIPITMINSCKVIYMLFTGKFYR